MAGAAHTPVATYVRMSTDEQVASPMLQREALERYAALHAMQIVRRYADEGQSGLVMAGRRGLQQLLADALGGEAGFVALLIYDVSRWGRFQDVDEGAYYEFLCRRAGIRVIYCAEHFVNDGAPLSQLLKSIKRSMAAEFSRELSTRVFAAQCRLAAEGFKQGGTVKYGLRRLAIPVQGGAPRPLAQGERKPRPTDRVIFGPGSAQELQLVRRIFALFIGGMRQRAIARLLNAEGMPAADGRAWTDWLVKGILCCELYCGTYVYNVGSTKMRSRRVLNAPEARLRRDGVLEPVISRAEFEQALAVRRLRNGSDREAVLAQIRHLHAEGGGVDEAKLRATPGMPGYARLCRMFGGLHAAYVAAGIARPKRSISARLDLRPVLRGLRRRVCGLAERAGARAVLLAGQGEVLAFGGVTVRVLLAAANQHNDGPRWRVPLAWAGATDFILCGLLAPRSTEIARYVLAQPGLHSGHCLYFCARNYGRNGAMVYPDLEAMFGLPAP